MFDEEFKGYCMNADGSYKNPVIIDNDDKLKKFIADNVSKFHELRITDGGDLLCFHVIKQVLIHPIPPQGSVNNKWDEETKQFKTI